MSSYEERFVQADANLMIQEKLSIEREANRIAYGMTPVEMEYFASELCRLATTARTNTTTSRYRKEKR